MTMDCPVCFEITVCMQTKCGHYICEPCLDKWFYLSTTCPLCRTRLISNDDMEIVIINEDDSELVSVLLPVCNYNHHLSADEILNRLNDKWKNEPTTFQFANEERHIHICLYIGHDESKKWYIHQFYPYIKERLYAHSDTFQIVCEFEKIFAEAMFIT